MSTPLVRDPIHIGCKCGYWPDCGEGIPVEAPRVYDLMGPTHFPIAPYGLRQIADSMMRTIESIETGVVERQAISRGTALAALIESLNMAEAILREVRAYALDKQYGMLESELPHGYVPLADPLAKKRKVLPA